MMWKKDGILMKLHQLTKNLRNITSQIGVSLRDYFDSI